MLHNWQSRSMSWCVVITMIALVACQKQKNVTLDQTIEPAPTLTMTSMAIASETPSPTITPTVIPPCYQTALPESIMESYAIQGWQAFAQSAGFSIALYYFPADCSTDSLERDGQAILYGNLLHQDQVGLVVLNPVESSSLGKLYQHLIQHEYWQMGPEDYPAVLDDPQGMNKNLVFLRVDELNGDNTIIGNPLVVMTSLAEHEYIHIVQSRNNSDLAGMVWNDKDYQAFIEGYANIGNASSQRYYFETKAAIEILQSLDLMNRSGNLQPRLLVELEKQDPTAGIFNESTPFVYDRHVRAFFLRVGGQAYIDSLEVGEISPLALFCRAGSGDLAAYGLMREILR